MDYGYTEGVTIPRRPNIDLGSNFLSRAGPAKPSVAMSDAELLRDFVELVQRSPEFGWRAGQMLGAQAFSMPVEHPDPIPRTGITAIEASFGDRGPSKAKRTRRDQAGARFDVVLQVSTTKDRGVSSASFRGRADFYAPERALAKAEELSKPTKCRTPFTPEYLALIREVIESVAVPGDMLVGFIHSKPPTGGTHYHQGQIALASRSALEARQVEDAMLILDGDKGLLALKLPPTSTKTSTGKALGGKFVMQSRGEARTDLIGNSWATGLFHMRRS